MAPTLLNLRIYRSLPYFCTGTDHCKYRRPGKPGPTSACRYSTWKCVQCIFKLCCLYCGRQRWNPDSYFLADGKSGRREMGKSGCDYSCVFIATLFFCTQSRILNMMLLGDEVSITLGTDLHRYRQVYLVVTALLIPVLWYIPQVSLDL